MTEISGSLSEREQAVEALIQQAREANGKPGGEHLHKFLDLPGIIEGIETFYRNPYEMPSGRLIVYLTMGEEVRDHICKAMRFATDHGYSVRGQESVRFNLPILIEDLECFRATEMRPGHCIVKLHISPESHERIVATLKYALVHGFPVLTPSNYKLPEGLN